MSLDPSDVTGVLLAGGLSRRMFASAGQVGGDKGLLELQGRPMIAHVRQRLAPQVGAIVLNANGDPARFAALGLPVAADTVEGFVGPLAGVLAGMRWSAANAPAATYIATVSTDAPFIPGNLVARLSAGLAPPARIALAASAGEVHPVIGLWPVALADDLDAALKAGVRKVLAWTDRHGSVTVDFPLTVLNGSLIDPFFNANTPEELSQARLLLGE